MLKSSGFIEKNNNFSEHDVHEVLAFFHHYDFRDKNGRELVACKDFIDLVNQTCSKQGVSYSTPAELVINDYLLRYVSDAGLMHVKGL